MGYACPVCGAEQADAEHLANHLAVTASLGREEHESWLEEHAPDWADRSPAELGAIVSEHAEEIDTPEFEGGHAHGHEPGRPGGLEDGIAQQSRGPGRGSLTAEAEDVLQEARELTRRMQSDASDDAASDAHDAAAEDADGNENA
ncbi:DUF5810 domain-containing protein [Halopiger goleimassiliensis]|uniref:DUF5810 domain-containing protein n=1 Tax=Halopiger goleimassiliensis TaxID=1293048 RepID=UPI0006778880|nr:DUF5810 domain-containing protein [Halopiger goleimassiliensis]